MAALAADGGFGHLHAVQARAHHIRLPRVANQAALADGTIETLLVGIVVSRRHLPALAGRVPRHRRLDEEALGFDGVGARVPARADHILEGIFAENDLLFAAGEEEFAVPQLAVF